MSQPNKLPKDLTDKQLIKELINTVIIDVELRELTALTTLFEVMLGFTINREILEEYLSWRLLIIARYQSIYATYPSGDLKHYFIYLEGVYNYEHKLYRKRNT